jgi:hypothetical protein
VDLTTFGTKIKYLHAGTAQRLNATGNEGDRREMQGYLRALDQVSELIQLARDAARLEQQLARKRSLLEQDPTPDWSHLTKIEDGAASATIRPPATHTGTSARDGGQR